MAADSIADELFHEELLAAVGDVTKAVGNLADGVRNLKPVVNIPPMEAGVAPIINAPVTVQPADVILIDRPKSWIFQVEKKDANGKLMSTMTIIATTPAP